MGIRGLDSIQSSSSIGKGSLIDTSLKVRRILDSFSCRPLGLGQDHFGPAMSIILEVIIIYPTVRNLSFHRNAHFRLHADSVPTITFIIRGVSARLIPSTASFFRSSSSCLVATFICSTIISPH